MPRGVAVGGVRSPRPESRRELLKVLRGALARAPQPLPEIAGVPLLGGLVGYTAYDAVRYFERVPGRSLDCDRNAARALCRAAIAAGVRSPDPRRSRCCTTAARPSGTALRREVMRALRGAVPALLRRRPFLAGDALA